MKKKNSITHGRISRKTTMSKTRSVTLAADRLQVVGTLWAVIFSDVNSFPSWCNFLHVHIVWKSSVKTRRTVNQGIKGRGLCLWSSSVISIVKPKKRRSCHSATPANCAQLLGGRVPHTLWSHGSSTLKIHRVTWWPGLSSLSSDAVSWRSPLALLSWHTLTNN